MFTAALILFAVLLLALWHDLFFTASPGCLSTSATSVAPYPGDGPGGDEPSGLFVFFGGGGGDPPKVEKQKPVKLPEPAPIVIPPAPKPDPIPPPTENVDAPVEAAEEERRKAAKRKGVQASLLAGESGGYKNPATGGNTLLGN